MLDVTTASFISAYFCKFSFTLVRYDATKRRIMVNQERFPHSLMPHYSCFQPRVFSFQCYISKLVLSELPNFEAMNTPLTEILHLVRATELLHPAHIPTWLEWAKFWTTWQGWSIFFSLYDFLSLFIFFVFCMLPQIGWWINDLGCFVFLFLEMGHFRKWAIKGKQALRFC